MAQGRKRGRRRGKVRWLVRRGSVDYGPYTQEQVFESFVKREIDLGTLVVHAGGHNWQPAGVHAEFRDFYAQVEARWQQQELEESVDREERKLKAVKKVQGGAWKIAVIGLVVFVGLGSWIIYRIVHAEPTGIMEAVAFGELTALPEPPAATVATRRLTLASATRVKRLREFQSYDTGGVGMEGSGPAPVTRLDFDDNGNAPGGGPGLSQGQLQKVIGSARSRLVGCAQSAAERSSSFRGTKVSFLVTSGKLTGFTVGQSAIRNAPFKACVKAALKRVKVPSFAGSDRRVTIPLQIR